MLNGRRNALLRPTREKMRRKVRCTGIVPKVAYSLNSGRGAQSILSVPHIAGGMKSEVGPDRAAWLGSFTLQAHGSACASGASTSPPIFRLTTRNARGAGSRRCCPPSAPCNATIQVQYGRPGVLRRVKPSAVPVRSTLTGYMWSVTCFHGPVRCFAPPRPRRPSRPVGLVEY